MNRVCPERITQARELAGLSKTAVAEQLDVSPAAVAQWESGAKQPTADNVAALSQHLGVSMPLLMKAMPVELNRKGPVTFRAWSNANTRRANRKAERLAEMVSEIFLWLGERIQLPQFALPEISNSGDIEEAAAACRRAWGLGDRPILKLGELLETKGVLLGKASFGDNRFDAFSCIINGRPFIFLGSEKDDRARSRFDAAHELGHLVLHQHLTEADLQQPEVLARVENEANKFGGAFLLPGDTFSMDVLDSTLDGFLKLKPKWGVSVQAMVVRAFQLGIIRKEQYQELFRQMGVRGWRKAKGEPFDEMVPPVTSSLGRKSLELLKSSGVIHTWEIPSELPVPLNVLCDVFQSNADAFESTDSLKIIPLASYFKKTDETSNQTN